MQDAAPSTDHGPIKDALERMVADGGTAMGDAISRGLRAARVPVPRPDGKGTRVLPAALVLLSDGANNAGALRPEDAAAEAKRLRIPIFTIALGTEEGVIVETNPFGFTRSRPVPPDKPTLRAVARITGGRYFEAPSAERPAVDLQPPRHAAVEQAGQARGHLGLRRGRPDPAAGQRRDEHVVVRPRRCKWFPISRADWLLNGGHFSASVVAMTTSTQTRITLGKVARESYRALSALDDTVDLDPALRDLVKLRASQINGCAFCVDMHSRDALAGGEDERRVWAVAVWREAPFFDERERAALALTEAMTRLPDAGVPDDVYDEAARHFDEHELGQLMFAIITINAWNRVAVPTHLPLPD